MTENEKRAWDAENVPAAIEKRDNPRKTGRAYRRLMTQRKHQRRLWIVINLGYDPRVGYIQYDFVDDVWQAVGDHLKFPKNSNLQKWIKQETSIRMRHCQQVPQKGNYHHKVFDYWWTLY